jgi:hypothetical protein
VPQRLASRFSFRLECGERLGDVCVALASVDLIRHLRHGRGQPLRVEGFITYAFAPSSNARVRSVTPVRRADEDDRNTVSRVVGKQGGGDFPPRDARHHDVEQDHVGAIGSVQRERLVPVRRLQDAETSRLEIDAAECPHRGMVVDLKVRHLHSAAGSFAIGPTVTTAGLKNCRCREARLGERREHLRQHRRRARGHQIALLRHGRRS